jgi:hypothetical protein
VNTYMNTYLCLHMNTYLCLHVLLGDVNTYMNTLCMNTLCLRVNRWCVHMSVYNMFAC